MATDVPLADILVHGIHRFATCWKIERTDGGAILYFTDHNHSLTVDGASYNPVGSITASATRKQEGMQVQNKNVVGAIRSDKILDSDLLAGRYRGAKITEFGVDWRNPWAGKLWTSVFYIGETKFDNEQWKADVQGLVHRLQVAKGRLYTRECWYRFGDTDCGIDLEGATVKTTLKIVSAVTNQRYEFTSNASGFLDHEFDEGQILWASGSNQGTLQEVKDFDSANGNKIEIQAPTPFDIAPGDTFYLYRGCDKRIETCRDVWNNKTNFGGFNLMPGTDQVFSTPDAR